MQIMAKIFKGKVESIAQGIDISKGVNSSRTLPYVQQTINWIRLAQRFPVKIKITNYNPKNDDLLIGANAIVKIISEK